MSISADPNDPEVQAIAAFLRVLNALENIRSSLNVAERGRRMTRTDDMRELAGLSLAETIDAMQLCQRVHWRDVSSLAFCQPASDCLQPG